MQSFVRRCPLTRSNMQVSFTLPADALHDVTIGERDGSSTAVLGKTPIAGSTALRFGGAGAHDARETALLAPPTSSPTALIGLPDASGTALLSSTQPSSVFNATMRQHLAAHGGVVFDGQRLRLGRAEDAEGAARVDMDHARLLTPLGLQFEAADHVDAGGSGVDFGEKPVVTVGMEEPSASRNIRFPDASGTILTADQLSNTAMESLRVMERAEVQGDVDVRSASIELGNSGASTPSFVNILARLAGDYPLSFDCDLPARASRSGGVGGNRARGGEGEGRVCLSIARPLSEAVNTISLPDSSGTVITTGNMPNPLVAEEEFRVSADAVVVSTAGSVLLGSPQDDAARLSAHTGVFLFQDSLPMPPAPCGSSPTPVVERDNQFVAVARGGVTFETGRTVREGRPLGCSLGVGASAWSALSDRTVKTNVSVLSPGELVAVADDLAVRVPVSTWQYSNHLWSEGGAKNASRPGSSPRRLGPMAQDVAAAFGVGGSDTRIDTIDADGIVLAAIQGSGQRAISLVHPCVLRARACVRVRGNLL